MVFVKNPFRPDNKTEFSRPENQSAGILDDYAVRKVINTEEGTIERAPVNATDIVNKAYADSLVIGAAGVSSLSKSGAALLSGAITLSEGANITLTQAGQDIAIASTGGGVTDHAALSNLDYASAGHNDFASGAHTHTGVYAPTPHDSTHHTVAYFYQNTDVDHNAVTNTHNLTTDIDHNSITNAHNLTTDIDHDALTNFVANEHIDWTNTSSKITTTGNISGGSFYTNGKVSGANVTSGADPGHTHTSYNDWKSGAGYIWPLKTTQIISGAGFLTTGPISGANVTSGNDPGHTHSGTTEMWKSGAGFIWPVKTTQIISGGGFLTAGKISGANVTSGADPGHTHTAYLTSEADPSINSGANYVSFSKSTQIISGAGFTTAGKISGSEVVTPSINKVGGNLYLFQNSPSGTTSSLEIYGYGSLGGSLTSMGISVDDYNNFQFYSGGEGSIIFGPTLRAEGGIELGHYAGDGVAINLGTDNDAAIYYDGTNLIIDPAEVGTGTIVLANIPRSDPGVSGAIWNSGGTLKIN